MVQINFAQRTVNAKIVYYGPGMSGKTTNLEVIHQRAPSNNRGELTSISTDGDRTLFFDFMPLDLGTVAGMRTCFQIYTVPGQVYYNSTRKLVLQGVDGVVFVADSSASMQEENLESMRNLQENLAEYGRSLEELPLVIQYNKRDLPDAMSVEDLEALLNPYGAPSFEGIANTGQGVFPTLKALAACVIEHIHRVQQGAAAGGSSGQEAPPRLAQTGFHAPPAAQRATLEPPAPFAQPAAAHHAHHEEPELAVSRAQAQPMAAPQPPAVDPNSLRLARPITRTGEGPGAPTRPQAQARMPQPPPSMPVQMPASQATGATRGPAAPARAQRGAQPQRQGGPRQPAGAGRPQAPAHLMQPEAETAPAGPARARGGQVPAPMPAHASVLSTPMPQGAGKRSALATALIVGGSVIVGAAIGTVVLSYL